MQYPSPDQPFAVKAINRVGGWATKAGLGGLLDPERLMQLASKQTGLGDFGEETFLPGLEMLVQSLNEEARLSTIGKIAAKTMILDRLKNRLAIIDYRKQRPEVAEQRIERPVFVLGLPRTGTTIFYELLAQDPNHRWPISYAVERPIPPPKEETFFTDPRIPEVEKKMAEVEILAPGFQSIHAVGATLPQECIAMTSAHFMSEQYGVMYFIPSYNDWLRAQDASSAYRWHRMFLQHLQVDFSKPRWLLKSPGHLPFIQAIVDEYPNAAIIQTHRDPMKVMASVSSLACVLHSAFSNDIDPLKTAACETAHYSGMLEACLEQRDHIEKKEGPGRFFDVQFEDILKRPFDVVEQLYAHFGFEWNADIRARMETYLRNRPRDKHGTHQYTLEEFGLSEEKDGPLFSKYRERFGVSSQA